MDLLNKILDKINFNIDKMNFTKLTKDLLLGFLKRGTMKLTFNETLFFFNNKLLKVQICFAERLPL